MQVPGPIEYQKASSVDDAIGLMDRLGGESRLIAGGHSLIPLMKLRLADLEYLVDINELYGELGHIAFSDDEVRIGAMARHRDLLSSSELASTFPIFGDAERVIADPVVRNRGTIGGSLCQADPSEDLSAVCTTLDASCVIVNSGGQRVVSMADFYRGPYETAVAQGEILTEIRFPIKPGGSSAYAKVERRAGDWAVVSSGAAVWMDGDVITDARVGLAAVGPNTTGIPAIGEALRGQQPSEELYDRAAHIAADNCEPATDGRGSADYKRHLAAELTRRSLRTSVERRLHGHPN